MGVLLAVGALAIGCVLAVLWSYISNYLEESKAKDRWKRVQEKLDEPPASGGSKARKTKASPKPSPKPTPKPTQPKAAVVAAAVPAVLEEEVPEEIDDVEVSDEAPETAEEEAAEVAETTQETSPEKAKKKKKRKPAKSQEVVEGVVEDEAEIEEAQEAEDAEEEEADAEEKINAEALGLDGWTVTKAIKKKAAHADDAEATDEEDEEEKKKKDEEKKKEKAKKEKVSDLRRRKAQINKKITDLEQVLETKHQREEENKMLEARARLSADLENINRSIQRLTGPDRGNERVAVEAAPDSPTDGADGDAWQEGYPQEGEQWEQHEWAAGTEWWGSSRGKGRGKSWDTGRGKGKGQQWEEAPAAAEDWQEQEWWGSAATASTGTAWVEKGKGQRRGRRGGVQNRQWAEPAWWEDASWEAGAVDASASSWQVVGTDAWEGGEWAEDRDGGAEDGQQNTVKRERRRKGRGDKGEGKGEAKGEGKHRRQEWPEDEDAAWESTSRSPQATPHGSPAPAAKGEDHKGSRRERKGKGKGKEGKDHDSGENNQWDAKGEDSGGKGKGKKGKKGKDENGHKDEKASMEDWLRQRLGVRKPAGEEAEPQPTEDAIDRGEELRQAIAPLFGNKIGERPNWGDAESSDEDRNDRPAAVKRLARPAHLNAALKNTETTTASMQRAGAKARQNVKNASPPSSPEPRSCDVEGVSAAAAAQSAAASKAPAKSRRPLAAAGGAKGDEDLSAFIGEDALHDDKKFEEAIKYVPTWVREKALRQRKQSRPTTES